MKLVIVSCVFEPEPIVSAQISADLAEEMSRDSQVIVLSPRPTRPKGFTFPKKERTEVSKFQHIVLDSFVYPDSNFIGRLIESISFGISVYRYLTKNAEDVTAIYANTWPIFSQLMVVLAAKKKGKPLVLHVQDIYPEAYFTSKPFLAMLFGGIPLLIDRYTLNNASYVVSISDKMKQYLVRSRYLSSNKIVTILNWQRDEVGVGQSILEKRNENVVTFMYLGNIGPVAGCDMLIDSFVKSAVSKSRLVIAGNGTKRDELSGYVKDKGFSNIEFWDVPEGKVQEIQSKSDFLVLPIRKGAAKYSVPSKLIAYMRAGRPIIAIADEESDTCEMIKEAGCGFTVNPDDQKEIANIFVQAALISDQQRAEYGSKAISYAKGKFNAKQNVLSLRNLILKATNEHS